MACERPPRSLRSRLPLTRGRAAGGGRGSLKHYLEPRFGILIWIFSTKPHAKITLTPSLYAQYPPEPANTACS
jgi:hypothetical protein